MTSSLKTPKGYIGLTDPDWYRFLASKQNLDEVNFWQPRGGHGFRALERGDPFFFKLRAPLKAIVGFGFFERFETLPAWLAWECFGEMNGGASFSAMLDAIRPLRTEPTPLSGDFEIGCIMLTAPVFFPEDRWVDPPSDWAKTGIQKGKIYALDHGEGARIFKECLERAENHAPYWNVDRVAEPSLRYGVPVLTRPRLGQGTFRLAVREAYRGACAVTGEHSQPVLEAAHIRPYGQGGEHRIDNGLFLRSDLHRLFDLGYVTVTPDHTFLVGDRLREEYNNGRTYYQLSGSRIRLPENPAWIPDENALAWHKTALFRG